MLIINIVYYDFNEKKINITILLLMFCLIILNYEKKKKDYFKIIEITNKKSLKEKKLIK